MKVSYLGRYEKQNSLRKDQQSIRTRQYANNIPSPSNLRSPTQKDRFQEDRLYTAHLNQPAAPKFTPNNPKGFRYEETLQNQRFEKLHAPSILGKDRTNEHYQTFKNYQQFLDKPNHERKQNVLKPRINQIAFQDSFQDHSGHGNSFAKRQNARAKGFEMKMNNIDSINDKIGNLLSMVKRDRSKTPNKINDNLYQASTKARANIEGTSVSPKNKHIINDRNKNQFNKRLKTYSAYDRKEEELRYSPKHTKEKYNEFNNEEQRLYTYDKKSERALSKANCDKYSKPENFRQRQIGLSKPKNGNTPKTNLFAYDEHEYYRDPKVPGEDMSSFETRWKGQDEQGQNLYNQKPKSNRLHLEDYSDSSFLPYSLQNPKNCPQQKYKGPNIIDEKLKKIHQKIIQSEAGKNRLQRRLQERINQFEAQPTEEARAGQLYRRPACPPNKMTEKFEIKVHPVKVDKENVVKMAVALQKQADLDKNLAKLREQFLKEEGQNKWEQLQSQLREQGVRLTIQEIKQLVAIGPEQFSILQDSPRLSCQQLGTLLGTAQKHWQNKVCGCVYSRTLKAQGFNEAQIDFDRKGYISQQDILEFIAKYTGKSLTTRDISLVFRRLTFLEANHQSKGVSFGTFMRVLAL